MAAAGLRPAVFLKALGPPQAGELGSRLRSLVGDRLGAFLLHQEDFANKRTGSGERGVDEPVAAREAEIRKTPAGFSAVSPAEKPLRPVPIIDLSVRTALGDQFSGFFAFPRFSCSFHLASSADSGDDRDGDGTSLSWPPRLIKLAPRCIVPTRDEQNKDLRAEKAVDLARRLPVER